jgi:hypothetical protein
MGFKLVQGYLTGRSSKPVRPRMRHIRRPAAASAKRSGRRRRRSARAGAARRRTPAAAAVHVAVFARHHVGQFAAVVGTRRRSASAASLALRLRGPGGAATVGRRGALAQVVHQAGPAHRQRRVQRAQVSSTSIRCTPVSTSGWCSGGCGTPHRRSTSGSSRASAPQSRSTSNMRLGPVSIRPRDSSCHTRSGTRRRPRRWPPCWRISARVSGAMREGRKARREARQPQQAHGVFDEGVGDMAQHAAAQVALAAAGVDQRAVFVARHGIDGQVAARQVLFQRHLGRGVEGEAVVARRRLALGARQRHFFVRLRVQEDREVAPTGGSRRPAVLGRGAHHHPVAVAGGPAQQRVAHRAADDVEAGMARAVPISPRSGAVGFLEVEEVLLGQRVGDPACHAGCRCTRAM